ncbi:Toll/interleukin-1 receptor homology (TIR) domain [Arabidopsis suecica]|uniref:ADP-ribosyl cyclase/cyclic ADP-ribose hydrolase n=1 Tax=Arabidopsis suecica TaxID=45249 RepID=A0A8T1ZWZ2_ARASU|nr:Toll/interleukin-1 receptor homology (TIR) domain [Arabidopsis suecica]
MGSVMSLSCSKRKATSQDLDSESRKRRKICSTNDDENCRFIPDESSWKHPWSLCANSVVNVTAAVFTKFGFQRDNKDTKSSALSLLSPPTLVSRIWKHHVFPSFHGADVRKTILSHILESFRRKGIDPFIDNNIERSKSIGPKLLEAIKGSKIAIVLLSKNYASSSWCLDELAEIMKCREVIGQIVMTIFYEVEPTEIKKQTGDFGKAFRKTCKDKPKEHIEKWRTALKDVATIAGYHSRNWTNEADMIEKISTDVSNMLNNSIPSRDFDGFVGMTAHMERMEKFLSLDLDEVRMIGLWGPPGIGKTTIATFLFDRFSSRFQLAAIMADIRECYPRLCLDERNAQLKLQKQMLSLILNQKDIMVSHLGVAQERLKDKKVFLVLDEVDHSGQLDALAKEIQWFGPGSRIIITTEDLRVLKAHGINHIYKVNFPSSDEAFQIFCMYAFGQKHPYEGFYELAWEVTNLSGKLPLGLKVLGSALRGMSKPEWERALPRLKTSLDGKIENIIQFSYDALCDEDKYLFLYIACLFIYKSTTKVKELLGKFLDVRQGLYVLAQKSLISIDGESIGMHTLLEQFGRETARKEFIHHGYTKHQLLVGERDICEVLDDDTIDSRRFIGINLDLSKAEEELNISEKALKRMHDFQFVTINDKTERLQSVLQGLIYHSPKIRSLNWNRYQSICLPSTFNPEFLVELNLQDNKLQKLWEGTKQLRNLKWMNLLGSKDLKELPDLSTATNLEEVNLRNCSSLVELPSSIGNATKLELLNLDNCSSLVKLPSSINAPNLQVLYLNNCSRIVELPAIENATSLEKLCLVKCSSLVRIPSSIENATNLRELDLIDCSNLVELPSIGNATKLERLYLDNCSSLVKLPSSIGDMTNLWALDMSRCSSLLELPSSIGNLHKLSRLTMCGCSKLEALPTNIYLESLDILDLTNCSQLKRFPEISTNIEDLRLTGTAIKEVPLSIMSWSRLYDFGISYFESLKEFPHALDIITELQLNEDIQEVAPWVKGMSRLHNCQSLERLDCSFNNPNISLNFSKCFNLNQEARDLIMHTSTSEYAILPGTQVPACFNHLEMLPDSSGGSLTIKLNESPLPTSLRFKACIMPVMGSEETGDDPDQLEVNIDIRDKQNDLPVLCTPSRHYIYQLLTEHIYTFEVETEEVTSTELVFEFKTRYIKSWMSLPDSNWKIKDFGISWRSLHR